MKKMTVPRLELMSAVIGVRLCQAVKKVKFFEDMKTFFWSDSTVVLGWIKTKGDWNTFVDNRIREICSFSHPDEWHHIPGSCNPSDLPSRGCDGKQLAESKWWEGPQWLKGHIDSWPKSGIEFQEMPEEEKRSQQVTVTSVAKQKFSENLLYFSKYQKICRLIGWIFRFKHNSLNKTKTTGELTYSEIENAEIVLFKLIQNDSNFQLDKYSKNNLQLFRDEKGLLRLKTKLHFLEDSESFRYPILLPGDNEIVSRLIFSQHIILYHVGVKTLLSSLREKFWIIRARRTVKRVLNRCIICKKFSQKACDSPVASLPKDRINNTAAFEVTGLDYAGPLFLRGGGKAWLVVFTCAVYRAVHFELVTSMSTDAFILALRRFISRRGRISTLYSDNGSQFVGCNNYLKNIDWAQVTQFTELRRIKWVFNPPSAAWWGGWWERIVRMAKEILRRNLGRAVVGYEELMTLICDCESVINSRPLTYMSDDDDLNALTPSHFLQPLPGSGVLDLDLIDRNHLLKRQRYIQKLRESCRIRFRNEYLANLVNFGSRRQSVVQVGDVVLLELEHKKRITWPLARVLEIFPGRDNIARVARIKVNNGVLIRPIQRLYPLELSSAQIPDSKSSTEENIPAEQESHMVENKTEEKKLKNDETTTRSGRRVRAPERFQF